MENPAIKNGLILGIIWIFLMLTIYFSNPIFLDSWPEFVIFFIAIYFMFKSANEEKNINNILSIREGFKAALLTIMIGLLAGLLIKHFIMTILDPNLPRQITEHRISLIEQNAHIFGEDYAENLIGQFENQELKMTLSVTLSKFLFLLIFPYAPISLIIGLITKKENEQFA